MLLRMVPATATLPIEWPSERFTNVLLQILIDVGPSAPNLTPSTLAELSPGWDSKTLP
jgi:hypothetical protein